MASAGYIGVVDWDGHTVKLYGLDMAMKLKNVREATTKGLISPFANEKAQDQLKAIATNFCIHQEATPLFRERVSRTLHETSGLP